MTAGALDVHFPPPEKWRTLQADAFAAHLQHVATSPLYKPFAIPTSQKLSPAELEALLPSLISTTKDDLAAAGPAAIGVPLSQIAEWVSTSGTAGKPLDVPLTARDLERLACNEAAALALAGISAGDTVFLLVGMDRLFVAGLAYWLGAQRLGAGVLRVGPQIAQQPTALNDLIARTNPQQKTFVISVPSFLTNLEPPREKNLAAIIAIGEPTRNEDLSPNSLAQKLTARFNCPVLSTYAATETCSTFAEGPLCRGGHLNPELAYIEILDDAGKPVPAGTPGEVTITPLNVEAMPLLRFRTGDIAALFTDPCPCGRTTPRLGPILGRKQQLLKYRGTSLYPAAIFEALRAIPEIADCALLAEREETLSDRLTVFIKLHPAAKPNPAALESRLRFLLRVLPQIQYMDETAFLTLITRNGSRKLQRFIDRR